MDSTSSSGSKRAVAGWVTTGLFALLMGASGALYVVGPPAVAEGFRHLGYPDYFRTLLGIAKVLGAVALVASRWRGLREWAYAGFTFDLLAGALSHFLSGDGRASLMPLAVLGLLAGSYFLRQREPRALGQVSANEAAAVAPLPAARPQ